MLHKTIAKWDIFEDCKRGQGKEIQAYVDRFDRAYTAVKSVYNAILPAEIRAFMLLKRAGVEEGVDRSLVMSKLDFTNRIVIVDKLEGYL